MKHILLGEFTSNLTQGGLLQPTDFALKDYKEGSKPCLWCAKATQLVLMLKLEVIIIIM